MPTASVVVPVYNRYEELRRALTSVAEQTLADLECVVVDDASTTEIQSVVAEFDERFIYVRREVNGGPSATRMTGLERVRGDLVVTLDSDNEFFPWTLQRAAHYLERYPQTDGAIGLHVCPDGFRVRVGGGVRVVGAQEFAGRASPHAQSDAVGVVRRCVVQEWLRLGRDYFTTEIVFSLSLHLFHSVVLVDEPWGRFHTSSTAKVSANTDDPRRFVDIQRFVDEFRPIVGVSPCGPLDVVLINMWARLVRAHRYREAAPVAGWMRERGIGPKTAIARKLRWSLERRLLPSRHARPYVL